MTETTLGERGRTQQSGEDSSIQQQERKGVLSWMREKISSALSVLDKKEGESDKKPVTRRGVARAVLQELAAGAREAQTGFATGLQEEGERKVQEMIEQAKKPFGEVELKAQLTREQQGIDRRTFLKNTALVAASLSVPPVVMGGAALRQYDSMVRRFGESTKNFFPNGEFVRPVQNATTVLTRKDGEWVVAKVPAMLTINTEKGTPIMPDDRDNPLPGVGYEKVVSTTSPGAIVDAFKNEGPSGAAHELRDLPYVGDQFDIVYINKSQLRKTVQKIAPDFPVDDTNLVDNQNLVSYLMDEEQKITGNYDKQVDVYDFPTLLAKAAEQGVVLERTEESLKGYLKDLQVFRDSQETLQRVVRFLLQSDENVLCMNNIGSVDRHVRQNRATSAPLPGIPIVLARDIESAQLYSDYIIQTQQPETT